MSETTAPAGLTITPAPNDLVFTAQGRTFWIGICNPGPVPLVETGAWVCWAEEVGGVWTVGDTNGLTGANLSGTFPGADGTVKSFLAYLAKVCTAAFASILPAVAPTSPPPASPPPPPVLTDAQKIAAALQAGGMTVSVASNGTVAFSENTAVVTD